MCGLGGVARTPGRTTLPVVARLTIVGGGNMGAALAEGLLRAGRRTEDLTVVEVVPARREQLGRLLPGVAVTAAPGPTEAAVIAVKPPDVAAACRAVVAAGATRVLSIAAGIRLAALEEACGPGVAVVRAMPNTPALVGEGATALAAGTAASEDDVAWAESVLAAVGLVVRVPEAQLDAVTGVSGSGPAYLFLVAEALIDGAVAAGVPRPTAEALVRQLFVGSAALLADDRRTPGELRAMVTSPGGTTAAGLQVLEDRAVRAAFAAAVAAAAARSRELG